MCNLQDMLYRIKNLKKEKGLTNENLSSITNIPKGTLDKVLSGIIKEPPVTTILKIAKALDVTTDYLIYGHLTESYGNKISHKYNRLNNIGKQKAENYIDDLLENPKYTTSDNIEAKQKSTVSSPRDRFEIAAYGGEGNRSPKKKKREIT